MGKKKYSSYSEDDFYYGGGYGYGGSTKTYSSKSYSAPKTCKSADLIAPVIITREVYYKIMYMTKVCDIEWSCMGNMKKIRDASGKHTHFLCDKIWVPEQKCTSAHTEMDEDDLAKLAYEAAMEGDSLQTWIHSHVNMDTFWSGTDHGNINAICSVDLLSIVVNKQGHSRTRYDINEPARLMFDDLDLKVDWGEDFKLAILEAGENERGTYNIVKSFDLSNSGLSDWQLFNLLPDDDIKAWAEETVKTKIKKEVYAITRATTSSYKKPKATPEFVSIKDYADEFRRQLGKNAPTEEEMTQFLMMEA